VPAPTRVVSLLPSLTEIVCALGAGERLVGRSHACDHPAAAASLPVLTAPRCATDPRDSSADLDARMRTLLRDALSPFTLDVARLRALAPDLILTQDQCRACAVSLGDVEGALAAWLGRAPRVLSVVPGSLGEVFETVRLVAAALELPAAGQRLLGALGARITAIGERTGARAPRPRVAVLDWLDPLMTAGHWLPELVAIAGGEALLARSGRPSRWIAFEELRAADPDVIVMAPCGYPLATTRRELARLGALPGWRTLRAVRGAQLFLADGQQYFNRPGPRLVESLEILAEILAPHSFRFGHEGSGWERV
jgi:iron complex transport system substrate-binding protein